MLIGWSNLPQFTKSDLSNDENDEYNAENKVVEEDAIYDADDEAEEEDSEDGILV